ncbi:complex I assembly factor TIMMDC1, mitochondrial [Amia ocellicauda]|uniref:complex I assembly factor TIMMDC1, mitochondrial n=1 Tax=Amia ocellicauda TaxID=2972642 RepID=UPI003463BDB6
MDRGRPQASTSQCLRTDQLPMGTFCNRLLRGFFPLPYVLAADGPASESSVDSPAPLSRYIGKPELPDTGWDRIKELFDRDEMQAYSEEISLIIKSGLTAAMVGMVYGGIPAARHAKERYIQQSQAEVYQHRMDAVRSAHNAAIRGFIRYGLRWSWRVTVFVTLFNTVSTGVSVYRDKFVLSHYAAAGAITGGLFRLNLGIGGMVAGTAIGAILGIPAGALIMAMQKMAGETLRERKRRERQELYELKLAEWNARLLVTEGLIGDIRSTITDDSTQSNLEKIDELLNLPRNEGPLRDSARDGGPNK